MNFSFKMFQKITFSKGFQANIFQNDLEMLKRSNY